MEALRKCKTCGLEAHSENELELFKKQKRSLHGRVNLCNACHADYNRKNMNVELNKENCKKWRANNPEKSREGVRVAKKAWARQNKHYINEEAARRRAAKRNATPPWYESEREQIQALYKEAREKGLHVDHIIPLVNDNVCGLHCLANLQLLTPFDNCSKGNKFDGSE